VASPPTTTRSLKLPTFSGGVEKDDLSPQDFVERIETYCKAMKRDVDDNCTEMHLALQQFGGGLSKEEVSTLIYKAIKLFSYVIKFNHSHMSSN
jgi:hypothetical protein